MKKRKTLLYTVCLLIVLVAMAACFLVLEIDKKNNVVEPIVEVDEEVVEEIDKSDPNRELWLANKQINDDYIGEVVFESNLVNKSFVQAKDIYDDNGELYHAYDRYGYLIDGNSGLNGNDVYIYTNWQDMSYDYNILGGSIFMDYRNSINDQNVIIYGHHFSNPDNDPDRVKSFTPLEKLLEEENYEENKYVKLLLDNEARTYELVGVYIYEQGDTYDETYLQYYRINYNYDEFNDIYDENYYKSYIDALEASKLYETDASLNTDDKTLTLQTCIGGYNGEKLQICVFKLIDTIYYEG